jgi:hypothetical protein
MNQQSVNIYWSVGCSPFLVYTKDLGGQIMARLISGQAKISQHLTFICF